MSAPTDPASRRAAAAARDLIGVLVNNGAGDDVLGPIAAELDALVERLAPTARRSRYAGTTGLRAAPDAGADNAAVMETHTVIGRANPIAPPMEIDTTGHSGTAESSAGDAVTATVTYGHQYEGPPGCVHGGMLAAAFDLVLAMSAATYGKLLVTGTLSVRYRRPTPLHTPLTFAGRLVGAEGRKVRSAATVTDAEGQVTAEAEGIFLVVEDERYRVE